MCSYFAWHGSSAGTTQRECDWFCPRGRRWWSMTGIFSCSCEHWVFILDFLRLTSSSSCTSCDCFSMFSPVLSTRRHSYFSPFLTFKPRCLLAHPITQNCKCCHLYCDILYLALLVSEFTMAWWWHGSIWVGLTMIFGNATLMLELWVEHNINVMLQTASHSLFSFFLFSRLCAWVHQWHPLIAPIYEE